jgi:hypothetical protein
LTISRSARRVPPPPPPTPYPTVGPFCNSLRCQPQPSYSVELSIGSQIWIHAHAMLHLTGLRRWLVD